MTSNPFSKTPIAIPGDLPPYFSPQRFELYTVDFDSSSKTIDFSYQRKSLTKDLRKAIEEAKDYAVPAVPPATPLDINLAGQHTYIFLKLNPAINWRFSRKYASMVMSKNDKPIVGSYGDFTPHYTPTRTIWPNHTYGPNPGYECLLVHFAAIPGGGDYNDSFNFYVDFFQFDEEIKGSNIYTEKILPIIIDPDIKHPGGTD